MLGAIENWLGVCSIWEGNTRVPVTEDTSESGFSIKIRSRITAMGTEVV